MKKTPTTVVSPEEMEKQEQYSLKVRAANASFASEHGREPLAFVRTFGI